MRKVSVNVNTREKVDLSEMPLKTLEDYAAYNKAARKAGLPVKVPTEDFYPKYKVKFQRFDQPENILKARRRTKDIDWEGALKPGKTYMLPMPVIEFLNSRADPIFKEVKVEDGTETKTETIQVGERPRFNCQFLEFPAQAVA